MEPQIVLFYLHQHLHTHSLRQLYDGSRCSTFSFSARLNDHSLSQYLDHFMVPLPQLYFPILLLNQPLSFSYFLVPLSQIWAPGLDIQYITLTSHALQCCLNVRRMQSALIHCRSPWKPFFEVHSPATATKISLDPCGSPEWHFIFSFFLSRSFVSEWIFDGENSSRWLRGSCTEMKWSPSAADWGSAALCSSFEEFYFSISSLVPFKIYITSVALIHIACGITCFLIFKKRNSASL